MAELAARRGDFARWIRETVGDAWRGGWRVHDVRTDTALPEIQSAAAFIITGSSSSVTERAPWMLRTEDYVRQLIAGRRPLLGICFGHQIMAQACGGNVTKNPRGREIGTQQVTRLGDDPLFEGLPASFDASETHVDSVTKVPSDARVLATTLMDPVAAFAIGPLARAVQFHPEVDADAMRGYVEVRSPILRSEGLDADAILANVREAPHAHALLRNFVRRFVSVGEGSRADSTGPRSASRAG